MIYLAMSVLLPNVNFRCVEAVLLLTNLVFLGVAHDWSITKHVCWMNDLASESGCFCGISEDGTITSYYEVGGIPREEGTHQPVLQSKKLPGPLRHIQRWQVKMLFRKCSSGL